MTLLFMAITAVAFLIIAVKFLNKQHFSPAETKEVNNPPTHFDLLDDNGEPIPSEPVDEELKYFCIKDKGYHVSVWPKNQGFQGVDYFEFTIAGIIHGEHVDDHLGEFVATLKPDPANPYDPQAIKIVSYEGHRVGYVPRNLTSNIRQFTPLPCQCYCYIGMNDDIYFSDCYVIRPE